MKISRGSIVAGLLALGLSLPFENATAEATQLRLQNAKITINSQAQSGTYSAVLTNFNFLYFYVPGQGLFIVSNRQFGRAVQAGKFEDRQLQFEISGIDFKMTSSGTILGKSSQPLWVYYDPSFTLDVKSIMFGYGDLESAPYDWPKQIGKHT
jgi:hypothetical protein